MDLMDLEKGKHESIQNRLATARELTWQAVKNISAKIAPGMRESEAIKMAQRTLADMGSRKFWHKCHVRFGSSTIYSFNDPLTDEVLGDNDIYYIDIGIRTYTTYALCGFANFSSIAIQIGGFGSLLPERRVDFAKFGFKAMLGGTLAAFMTACIAGFLI